MNEMVASADRESRKTGLPKGFFEMEVFAMTPDPSARDREIPDVDVDWSDDDGSPGA